MWGGVSSLLSKAGAESLPWGALKFEHEWNHRVATSSFFWRERSLPVLGGFGFWDGKLVGRGKLPYEQSRSGKPAILCTWAFGHGWNHRVATSSFLPVLGGFGFWDGKLVGRGKVPYEQSRSGKPAVLCALNLGRGGPIGLRPCLFSCI